MVDPALALGAAVVKATCKIWLKDIPLAADVSARMVDIIESKVDGVREKRKIKRIFEDLEERVADNLHDALKVEFANLPENERQATILAVAETFNKAKLTNRDLFDSDLDPLFLERHVRLAVPNATDGLSQDAIELYGRILTNCCTYIVEISNTLPGFEVDIFAALLKRQGEVIRRIEELFEVIPTRPNGRGVEFFETTYRRLVSKQLDKVELFGVTISEKLRRYPLSTAYVSLKASSSKPLESMLDEQSANMMSVNDGAISPKTDPDTLLIEEALRSSKRVFLRGDAGSGKTTLLQWLGVRSSNEDFGGHLSSWNHTIPFLIRLRRYSGKDLPRPERFLHDIGRHIADQMPPGWVHEVLRSGKALVLVDGVDELPEAQRSAARSWLQELVETYPDSRYIVTSRPAAASELWLDDNEFSVLEIQPMSLTDIETFVSHWHAAFCQGVADRTERTRISSCGEHLLEKIRAQRHLRMLATSPLLTALLCVLHLDRRMQLPRDRMELYSIALDMLLERRDIEREIDPVEPSVSRTDKTILLEDIAYWLIRNGWSDAPADRVLDRLAGKLTNMHRIQADAGSVLSLLLNRSGLIRKPVEGRIDFIHKTFQEFLAARAAIGSDDIGVLVQNAHDDQWREVVLMAAGHAHARQRDELLNKILERAARESGKRHILQALALACRQNSPELSPATSTKLHEVAAQLLPPKNFAEATALAHAGELALELLSSRTAFNRREAAATIRMSSMIGGNHALSIIDRCATDDSTSVQNELRRAWTRFDPETYAREILAKHYLHAYVDIEDPDLIPGLRYLHISALACRFAHGYGSLNYLSDLPNLNYFTVSDPLLTDISALATQPSLVNLELRKTGIFNATPLVHNTTIRRLDLPLGNVAEPSVLRELHLLESLQFYDPTEVHIVADCISPDNSLRRFGFWNATQLSSLSPLVDIPQLAELEFLLLGNAEGLSSIRELESWAQTMTGILLRAQGVSNVDTIGTLKLLDFANLSGTPIRSLEFASELSKLERLHIGADGCELPDLSPLSHLPALRDLHIWGNAPVNLSGLSSSKGLRVHIKNRRARNITGKENLPPSVKLTQGF